ncbi:MAG: ferrochelatase, partial [bacterium]|nr:ferrochelatase [bacterium]
MQNNKELTGVLLMTYGSATVPEQVREYFEHIYRGAAPETLVQDFEHRYRMVGRSRLVEITKQQAALLQKQLGKNYVVRAAMRHSAPFTAGAVAECKAAGATKLVGVILSPQYSAFIMGGYRTAFAEAALQNGFLEKDISIARPWPTEKHFIQL